MTPDHKIHELRLLDLVNGVLSPEEERETTDHVRECAECEARLRLIVADREALRAGPVPTMVDGRIQLVRPRRNHMRWVLPAAVAAALIVGAFGIFQAMNRESPPEYWIPVTDEPTLLRSEHDTLSGVDHALQSYEGRDASAAIEELQNLQVAPGDVTASKLRELYLASALVNAGRPEEGLEVLTKLRIEFLPTQWRYHAQWVQYVALLRAGRVEEAHAWLETLAQEPGETGDKAREELKRRR